MSSIVFRAPKIALLSGSLRQGSFNTRLIGAAEKAMSALGAKTQVIHLADYNLPIYHQDIEETIGMPEQAVALKQALGAADAWSKSQETLDSSRYCFREITLTCFHFPKVQFVHHPNTTDFHHHSSSMPTRGVHVVTKHRVPCTPLFVTRRRSSWQPHPEQWEV